jgi:hypothetical protein
MKPTPELLKVPFDEIYLPSMGLFYPTHKHVVKVRALTGYDEILLSSPYLAQTGSAIKLLFNNVVLEDDIEYDDLMLCDRDAILLFLRSTTYGDAIEMDYTCPECNAESKGSFNISSIEAKEINYPPDECGEFEFLVPSTLHLDCPVSIKFKPLKVSDAKVVKDNLLLNRYMACITSVNGNADKEYIMKYIKNMKIADSKKLREFMDRVEPGFEETVMHTCACGHQAKDVLKIDESFLSLPSTYRNTVNEECFLAYYYGKGITREETYAMPVIDRRWTINRISEEIEKQNKAEQEAVDKAKNKR